MVLKKHLKKTAAAALALLLAFSALPGETVLGNEIPETEIAEVNAISDPTGISEQTEISEQTDVSESEEAAAGVTVMFYDIGSDLEGNNMSSTNDLLEIMEGIYSSGIENPKVNFIVETGGMDPNFKNRNRAQVISEGREDLESTYRDFDEEKLQRYRTRYDYLTGTGTDGAGIKWNENQRFEIYPDELKPAKQQPSDPGRSMTASDDNNAVPELAEFIKTTKEDYPADQYMLIMWDHGGGPSDGFGIDERGEGMIKAWSIPATMDEAGVDGNSAFALVNYDACLMGNLETALVWSPYTRYYTGSEELEGGDGDYYEPWVKLLCQDAEQVDFSDGNAADQEFEEIGKEIVKDFRNWYKNREDTGTKSLIRTDKVPAVAEALSDFAKSCSRLFELDPLTSYNGIQQMRNISQDFYGRETGIIDISDFAYNMSSDKFTDIIDTGNMEMKAATDKMKSAGSALMKAVDQAVLLHQETRQYDLYHIGGITVYFPYMHANDFLKEYTDGYNGLEQTQSLQPYRDFLGSFASIQAAGADIWKNETEKAQVEKAFSDAFLEKYFTLTGGVTSATIKVADTPGEESAQITDKSKNGAKKALVGEIDPVTYTGMSIITTQSKGKGSKMIDLTLYSEDGKTRLQEGTHYKVSYRNNKNAADMKDRKAPTLIITGKGDYAGMKYEAVFTIRKASLNDASLSFDRSYAPLSSKGITLKTTATLPSGVKVPANQIRLHYFGTDGAERTTAQLAEAFKGNEVLQLTVAAEAVENSRNYEGISWEFPLNDVINAYPKSKGSLSVSLKNNRISAGERKSAYDFLCEQFKTAKMGKTVFALEDIQYHGLYADTKFMKPYEFGTLTTSGTCYLAVSLNPVKQKEYGNYKTVPVKVIVTKPEYEEIFFDEYWTYGDKAKITGGIARLYKTKAKKKKNLTVCINAGHGTKGGEKVKTLCHPDGSPKIVSGSTAAGATEALAIVPQGVTMSTGEVEAKATLKASLAVKDALLKEGYNVLMIRETDDVQLDNIARTLIANNNANAHIAIHYDSTAKDKGVFFCSVPEVESYLNMEPVKSHWKEHEKLGQSLVDGLESAGFKKWNSGALDMDLTQTSYSTVPSVDLEIGDTVSDYSDETLAKVAKGITAGVNTFFGK